MRKITWKKLGKADFYFGFVKQLSTYRILSRYRENMKKRGHDVGGINSPKL
jgi:hypothetical protein